MTRLEAVARAFLRYLYDDKRFRPDVGDFLTSAPAAEVEPAVAASELNQVLRQLRDHELIAAPGHDDSDIPTRVGLTGFGLICVDHYGGDVAAWARQQNASVTTITEHEQDRSQRAPLVRREHETQPVPIMVPPRSSAPPHQETGTQDSRTRDSGTPSSERQVQATRDRVTLTGLTRVARVTLLTLPTVHADRGETEVIEQTARTLLDATQQPRPDHRQVRRLAHQLRGELGSGSVANTLGVVLLDSLDEAINESQLL